MMVREKSGYLPAAAPNLLLGGTLGIAVGMASTSRLII